MDNYLYDQSEKRSKKMLMHVQPENVEREKQAEDREELERQRFEERRQLISRAMSTDKYRKSVTVSVEQAGKDLHEGQFKMSDKDQKSRYKYAQKKLGRFKNAQARLRELNNDEDGEDVITARSEAALKQMISSFKKVPSKKFRYKDDTELCDNFKEDHKLLLEQIKNGRAVERLYLTKEKLTAKEEEELLDLRARAEAFDVLKQFMELKIALISNPYYVVLSKEETASMKDDELDDRMKKAQRARNTELARFFASLLALRRLEFNRSMSFADLKKSLRGKNTEKWRRERTEAVKKGLTKTKEELAGEEKERKAAEQQKLEKKVKAEMAARDKALAASKVTDAQVNAMMKAVPDILKKYRGKTTGWILDKYKDEFDAKLRESIKTGKIRDVNADGGDSLLRIAERYNNNAHAGISLIETLLASHPEVTMCLQDREDKITKELIKLLGTSFLEREEEVSLVLKEKAPALLKKYENPELVERQKKISEAFPFYKYDKDFWKAVDASKLMDIKTGGDYLNILKEKEHFYDTQLKKIVGELAPTCVEPVFEELKRIMGVSIFNCTLDQFYMRAEDELHNPLLYKKIVDAHRLDFEVGLKNNKKVKALFAHKEKGFLTLAGDILIRTDFQNVFLIRKFMEKRADLFLDVLKSNEQIREAVPQLVKFESPEDLAQLSYNDFMTCFNIVKANAVPAAELYNNFLEEEDNEELQFRVMSRIMREQYDSLSFEKMVVEERRQYKFEGEVEKVKQKSALVELLKPVEEQQIRYSFMHVENAGKFSGDVFKLPERIRKLNQAHTYWQRIADADCRLEVLTLLDNHVEIEKLAGLSEAEAAKSPVYEKFARTVKDADKRKAILRAISQTGKEPKLAGVIKEFRLLDFNAELLGAGGAQSEALHAFSDKEYEEGLITTHLALERAISTEKAIAKFSREDKKQIFGNLRRAMVYMTDPQNIENEDERLQAENENVQKFGFRTYDDILKSLISFTGSKGLEEFRKDVEASDMLRAGEARLEILKKEGDGFLAPILPYLLRRSEVREVLNMGDNDDFESLKSDILGTFMPFIKGARKAELSKFEIDQYLLDNFESVYKNSAVNSNGALMENLKADDWAAQLRTFSDTLQNMKVPGQNKTLGGTLDEMDAYANYKFGAMGRPLLVELMSRDPMFMNKLIEDPKNYKEIVWKKMAMFNSNQAFINKETQKYANGKYKKDTNIDKYFISRHFDDITSLKAEDFKKKWAENVDSWMSEYDKAYVKAALEKEKDAKEADIAKAVYGMENAVIEEIKKTKDEGLNANEDAKFLRLLEQERVENPYVFMAKDRVLADRKDSENKLKRVRIKDSDVKSKEKELDEVLGNMLYFGKKLEIHKYIRNILCEAMLKDSGLKGDRLERHIRWLVKANEELAAEFAITAEEKKQTAYDPQALDALVARRKDKLRKGLLYLYINAKDHKVQDLDQKKAANKILEQEKGPKIKDYGSAEIVDKDVEKYGKSFEGVPLTESQRKALDKQFKENEKKIYEDIKGLHKKKESAVEALNISESEAFKNFEKVFASVEKLSRNEYRDVSLGNEVKEDIKSIQYGMYYMKPEEVTKLAENREKYYRTAALVYETAEEQIRTHAKTAGMSTQERRYILSGFREYLKKDIYKNVDEPFDQNMWASRISSLLNNDMVVKNITNANGAVYSMDRYGEDRLAYDEKTPDDVLIKLLKSGDKERIKKFKSLGAEEQQIFFAGLASLKRVDFKNGGTGRFFESVPGGEDEEKVLSKNLEDYVSGKQLNLTIDFGRSYQNLLKKNGKMDDKSFDAAFAFTEAVRKKKDAGKPIDMATLANAGNSILAARNYGKSQWRELSRQYDSQEAFRAGLESYLSRDIKKRQLTNLSDLKTELKDALKENINMEDIGVKLLSLSDSDMNLLTAILSDRTMLDYISANVEEQMIAGKVIPRVNAAARQTFKDTYLANSAERTALISRTSDRKGYTAAMQTLLSFQIKEDISTAGALKRSDFVESSIARSTMIDWKLMKNALNFMEELKNDLAKKNIVGRAPELIEQSGNQKAIAEYRKIKDRSEMSRSQFDDFVASQVASDEQAVLLGGYRALTDRQKALFIRALEHREILDISKKNLINNVILGTDRDYVDSAARFALIDDYIDHSYGTKSGFACSDETVLRAGKSLLSTQIADDLSDEDYRNKSVEQLQAGERFFIAKRSTAVDWKLFGRALQFVARAENENEARLQNAEMYRSMGNVKKNGRIAFSDKMLRRNIHTTGNRLVNQVSKDVRDKVKEYVPEGSALRYVLSKVLSVDNMNKVNELAYVPQNDEEQTSRKALEKQIELLENEAKTAVKKEFMDLTEDLRAAVSRAAVELMLTTGKIVVENVAEFIVEHKEELLAAGKFILKGIAAVGYGAYLGAKFVGENAYKGAKFVGKYAYKGAKYAAKYGYIGAKYAAKYGYIGARFVGKNVIAPAAEFIYNDIAKPVGRFVLENGKYVYIGAKVIGTGVYKVGKYILTSPPAKFIAVNGLKLAGSAALLALKNLPTTIRTVKFIKSNFDNLKAIKNSIGEVRKVSAQQKLTEIDDIKDQIVINKAAQNQTFAEKKLSDKGKERNAFMVDKGAFYLKEKYFDAIADNVSSIVSSGLSKFGGVPGKLAGALTYTAKEIINLVRHYLNDKGALEDFYKGPGKKIADEIKMTMLNLHDDKNGALAQRFKNVTENMSDLKIVRLAQGYENEKEHAEALGLNIVHSILFSTSVYNPNIANKNLAMFILKALKLENLAGKSDNDSARQLYNAILTA